MMAPMASRGVALRERKSDVVEAATETTLGLPSRRGGVMGLSICSYGYMANGGGGTGETTNTAMTMTVAHGANLLRVVWWC